MWQDDLRVCHYSGLNLKLEKPFINPVSSKGTGGVGNAQAHMWFVQRHTGSCTRAQGAHFISVYRT